MRSIISIFILFISAITLMGCVAENDSTEIVVDLATLSGAWRVEDIDQGGVIDNSMVTMLFEQENRISGSTGCNQYTGNVSLDDKAFQVTTVASTRRACVTALAKQEQRFLDALNDAVRYEIESNTWLLVFDASNKQRLKAIQMEAAPKHHQQDVMLEESQDQAAFFDCGSAGEVGIRFLEPETIEFSIDDRATVLEKVRSASGEKYIGDNITFWNKGSQALFSVDEEQYVCDKSP